MQKQGEKALESSLCIPHLTHHSEDEQVLESLVTELRGTESILVGLGLQPPFPCWWTLSLQCCLCMLLSPGASAHLCPGIASSPPHASTRLLFEMSQYFICAFLCLNVDCEYEQRSSNSEMTFWIFVLHLWWLLECAQLLLLFGGCQFFLFPREKCEECLPFVTDTELVLVTLIRSCLALSR